MAPEVRWQASSAAISSGRDVAASDRESVESLLRRLIKRIEESERRYAEALDELHARLGHISYAAGVTEVIGSPEETETLERLRRQLSDLARRLEQPDPTKEYRPLPPLDKAFAEVRAVSAGLANAEPDWFASISDSAAAASRAEPESAVSSWPGSEPIQPSPSFAIPPSGEEDADFDRRLIEMAQRLERSIGEAMPSSAIETLNARMEEISARFEAALAETPKLDTLHHIERQVADMGQQLGRVEQQAARIGAVEGQLQRLIDRLDETPAQMERAASKAAQETARLVSETGFGKPSAAERLDVLHRDIVTMNERNVAVDDRLVDTLAAMHDSIKGLMQQKEREKATPTTPPQAPPHIVPVPSEPSAPDYAQPEQRRVMSPQTEASLGTTNTPFHLGRATPGIMTGEAAGRQAAELPRPRTAFIRDIPFEETEDLAAAARRAAEAAAARAADRAAAPPRRHVGIAETRRGAEPGQHKTSLLMLVAALLLIISAALLVTRLKLKPDFEIPRPAAEQSMPAPAAEAPPLPDGSAPPAAENPGAPQEFEVPEAPHGVIPMPAPSGMGARSPVHLGAGGDQAEVEPVSLSLADRRSSIPGVSVMVIEP